MSKGDDFMFSYLFHQETVGLNGIFFLLPKPSVFLTVFPQSNLHKKETLKVFFSAAVI